MLNHIVLMGRLTADPELKHTPNNVAVTTFTLAVERDFKTQDGSKETDFFNIVAWRNLAEFVSKYFAKGRMAAVEGRLQTRKYRDKDGNNRTVTEILADNIYSGDSKNNAVSGTPAFAEMDEGEDDENLPF